jgi:hypothetical protein
MYKQHEINLIRQIQESLDNYYREHTVSILFEWMKVLHLPLNRWLKKMPTSTIDLETWGICPDNIKVCKTHNISPIGAKSAKDDLSVRNVAKHLHRSVVHYWVQYFPISGEVEKLTFRDWMDDALTFELVVSAKGLRKFLLKFTQKMLECSTHP